jgi:antitoxin MazE
MKVRLIRIGNSKGIRLPATILKSINPSEEMEIEIRGDSIVLTPLVSPREGWDEAFRVAGSDHRDNLWGSDLGANEFDDQEWTW